jgi:hypothetical protein
LHGPPSDMRLGDAPRTFDGELVGQQAAWGRHQLMAEGLLQRRHGDPKAGLRVQVHGVELVAERRAARAETARKDQARRDAQTVRTALAKQPGLGTTALRGSTGLSGDRCAAAVASLGPLVEVREDAQGKARTKRHYLRGGE